MKRKSKIIPIVLLVTSCAAQVILVQGGNPPTWLYRRAFGKNKLCVVGFSDPTFYLQDCARNSVDNARAHLGMIVRESVNYMTFGGEEHKTRDAFTTGGHEMDPVYYQVLENSDIESKWMDIEGVHGKPNACYAYVCIDIRKVVKKIIAELEEQLPEKVIENLRKNAEAIFTEKALQEYLRTEQPIPAQQNSSQGPTP